MSHFQNAIDGIASEIAGYPSFMICASVPYAMFQAHNKFRGRDWRRIKREVNKAAKKASILSRQKLNRV